MKYRHPENRSNILNFCTLNFSLTGSNVVAQTPLNATGTIAKLPPDLVTQHLDNEATVAVIYSEGAIARTANAALANRATPDNLQPTKTINAAIASGNLPIDGWDKGLGTFSEWRMSMSQTKQHRWSEQL